MNHLANSTFGIGTYPGFSTPGSYAMGAVQPWQQAQQLLQIVPQQLQQVQYLQQRRFPA